MGRNARTHEGSEQLWEYARGLIEKNVGSNIRCDMASTSQQEG